MTAELFVLQQCACLSTTPVFLCFPLSLPLSWSGFFGFGFIFVLLPNCNIAITAQRSSSHFSPLPGTQPQSLNNSSLLRTLPWSSQRARARKHNAHSGITCCAPSMEGQSGAAWAPRSLSFSGDSTMAMESFYFIVVPPLLSKHFMSSSADTEKPIWRLEIKRYKVKLNLRWRTPSVAPPCRRYAQQESNIFYPLYRRS